MCTHTKKVKIKNIPIAFGNAKQTNKKKVTTNKNKAFLNAFTHTPKAKQKPKKNNNKQTNKTKAFLNAPNNQKTKQKTYNTKPHTLKIINHHKGKPLIDTKNHNKTTNKHQNTPQI